MHILRGGELPSLAGSKSSLWQSGQIVRGDPGRGHLELPSLTLRLSSLMLQFGGEKKKGNVLIMLVWCSVICFIWAFALFELSSFLSLAGDLCGTFRWQLMKMQVLEFLERKERARQATKFTGVQMRKHIHAVPVLASIRSKPTILKELPWFTLFFKKLFKQWHSGKESDMHMPSYPHSTGHMRISCLHRGLAVSWAEAPALSEAQQAVSAQEAGLVWSSGAYML